MVRLLNISIIPVKEVGGLSEVMAPTASLFGWAFAPFAAGFRCRAPFLAQKDRYWWAEIRMKEGKGSK